MPRFTIRHAPGHLAAVAFAILSATCASPIKPGPPLADLIIQTVTPSAGPATGGTEVTIRGTGFAVGTAVSIGGRPATDVTVRGTDTITAKTPASATAGSVDISVTVNGRTGTLASGFRYEVVVNTAPTIKSIVAQGMRTRQPANFADYGETIRITAVVEDAQTPSAQLKYDWTDRCGGTFTGSGAQVNWTAPISLGLPQNCAFELIVSDGPRIATNTFVVRLHNSALEVAALAREFLDEFANSTIPAATTVRNFSDSCPGKAEELEQVSKNRQDLVINSHTYGVANVTVAFGASCSSGNRRKNGDDACILTPVEWRSTVKATGAPDIAKGISVITGVYRESRWWLCDSLFDGSTTLSLQHLY